MQEKSFEEKREYVRGLRGLELRARGLSPLDPRGAMVRATKTRLFARNTVKQAGEFLGVRNREKG